MKCALLLACLAWAVTASAQVPSYVPTDDLVAFYPLNGDALDAGPHGLDGTLNGASSIADRDGVAAGALAFDGQDDFIRVQHSAEFDAMASEFTISAWIQNEIWTQPNWLYYVSKSDQLGGWGFNGGFLLRAGADGGGGFGYVPKMETNGGEWQFSSPDPLIDTWEHVAFTFTGDSAHLYRDGQRVASRESLGGDMVLNAFDVIIGAGYEAQDHHVRADIDDIGFWSRALSEIELLALSTGDANPSIQGCMDDSACNYDSEANLDDGSCTYPGCTDSEACNYDETAGCDDGSCVFPPLVELGNNTTLCEGESLELSVDDPGLTTTWSTGATGSHLTVTESGTYSVETDISISDSTPASTAIEFGPSNPGLVAPASGGMNVYDEGEVTLASWVYASDQPGGQRIIALTDNGSVYQQYAMSIQEQRRLYFLSGTSEFEANGLNVSFSAIPIDEWAHVAVTVKSDGVRMYINGILDRFNPVQDQFPTSWTSDFSIGMRSDGVAQFNGKLSQIAVWNRALGDAEIHELFECPVNPTSLGLQALWLNGTNPDGTVIDESGNANNVAYGGASEAGPTQSCLTPCSASDTITVNFIDCESLCGPGTTWDPILQSCVADAPDAAAAEDCSLFTLQELSSGYLLQQGQLDLQDTLIIGLQQQVDSLNALLNNCPGND